MDRTSSEGPRHCRNCRHPSVEHGDDEKCFFDSTTYVEMTVQEEHDYWLSELKPEVREALRDALRVALDTPSVSRQLFPVVPVKKE